MSETDTTLDHVLTARHGAKKDIAHVDEPTVKLVIFTLDDDWFAFHGERIREVLPDLPVFYLPGLPPSMEGVINVRGDIESVIWLRSILHYPATQPSSQSRILLGQTPALRSGVRVDKVEEVLDVAQSRVRAPPQTLPEHLKGIALGIVTFGQHQVTVLDLERLFLDYRDGLR